MELQRYIFKRFCVCLAIAAFAGFVIYVGNEVLSYGTHRYSVGFFDYGLCGHTVKEEALSPDGARKAICFIRDCGATTSYVTNVSIVEARTTCTDTAGNVLSAQRLLAQPTSEALSVDRSYSYLEVHAKWIDQNTVVVRYDRRLDAWKNADVVVQLGLMDLYRRRAVRIKFEPVNKVKPFEEGDSAK